MLDWTNDDQPYALNVPGLFTTHGWTGEEFVRAMRDQLDQLVSDAEDGGRVMTVALHPFVIGQAFRARYLDQALEYIAGHEQVWVTTSDEIAEHYQAQVS